MSRWIRGSLRSKLLAGYLVVVAVGVATLFAAATLVAPSLFDRLMDQAMGPHMEGTTDMMSPGMMTGVRELSARVFREGMLQALGIAALTAGIAAVLASLVLSNWIARPVHHMLSASRRIAQGRYSERVPVGDRDEVGQLAESFNAMAATLEETERRRLELIGNVAHELRTPVANLEGYLEGLLDGVVAPSQQTWAFLHGEAGRLRRLVQDFQDLSRAEARQMALQLAPAQPGQLARDAAARLEAAYAEKGVTLRLAVPDDLPPVLADSDRTLQVLTNLLNNALRYTPPEGSVEVTADRHGLDVRFSVRDTGVGIAPEHLPHLFERFYRVDPSRSRAAGGSGIGLTIARALVEAMGGRIWVESPGPGRGATFSFTLPVAR
ncbi:sensor histidine kinase [Limnochorda pilosa]|uniref:histidine kinase n=1 Tax=Limnochorda pilosa TaxID=1555112 RepID=A0A0K2SQ57_LIMPI|nr:HAMP domain-containing sensor histidine kinase [Limnochorda pilosa]BAS29258.1 histidine kinase [Limnochorda pilosa]